MPATNVVRLCSFLGFLVSLQSVCGQCVPLRGYSGCSGGRYDVVPAYHECSLAAAAALAAADGGGFAVTSASPVPPHGVSVLSENEYAGVLAVTGQLPFLGSTQLEGAVPSAGAGAVSYGCGYGDVAIVSEDLAGPAPAAGLLSEGAFSGLRGCGCGALV
ncbi:chorion class B protein PC10-like [Battus philenor]|uniref:chorion class B protein PC10-like n=1 Tax=Battus philenor TaxID=42288 RepID=UPI0035D0E869